jgi:tetraacyldisaccharide-1-P 4'-kinase
VRALGALVRAHRRFPDHHAYRPADLAGLGAGGATTVTTAKDAPKLAALGLWPAVLEVDFEIVLGAEVLEALLDALPRGRASRERAALHEGLHG